jgi:8-oxo-dGTP pyrophosphatase MutT (NUDIX family)
LGEVFWARLGRALAARPPVIADPAGRTRAAVAILLRDRRGVPELLFIERARHDHDPWSGDIGFPGGKLEPGDSGPRRTAERETAEELGLDLTAGTCLGRLDDIAGATLPVVVSCFVYRLAAVPPLPLSPEVERAFWVALPEVLSAKCRCETSVRFRGESLRRPAIRLPVPGYDIVWGLSFRLLLALEARFTAV